MMVTCPMSLESCRTSPFEDIAVTSIIQQAAPHRNVLGDYQIVDQYCDVQDNGWDVTYSFSVVRRGTDVAGDLSYNEELDMHDLKPANTKPMNQLSGVKVIGMQTDALTPATLLPRSPMVATSEEQERPSLPCLNHPVCVSSYLGALASDASGEVLLAAEAARRMSSQLGRARLHGFSSLL